MLAIRSRVGLVLALAALTALPACDTDDAVERDTKDAGEEVKKGVKDVDGQ